MTIFSPQKFHQKAKNPRKRPIVSKFDVPKVPELYGVQPNPRRQEVTDFGNPDLGREIDTESSPGNRFRRPDINQPY